MFSSGLTGQLVSLRFELCCLQTHGFRCLPHDFISQPIGLESLALVFKILLHDHHANHATLVLALDVIARRWQAMSE